MLLRQRFCCFQELGIPGLLMEKEQFAGGRHVLFRCSAYASREVSAQQGCNEAHRFVIARLLARSQQAAQCDLFTKTPHVEWQSHSAGRCYFEQVIVHTLPICESSGGRRLCQSVANS